MTLFDSASWGCEQTFAALLIGLALIIGGEELVETSVVVSTLRAEKKRRVNLP